MEIKEKSVLIDVQGEVQEIPTDAVVVAVGSKSRQMDEISAYCEANVLPMHIIGDALKARRALNAVAEANEVARLI
jgi:NADH dehydrogenase FAD-containing subunit